jgi:hypothetical protein
MRYLGELIRRLRNDSNFKLYTSNTGIQDQEIIDLLNDAQSELITRISAVNTTQFQSEAIIDIVSGQTTYNTRGRLLHNAKIVDVKLQFNGFDSWCDIGKQTIREVKGNTWDRVAWALQNGNIVVDGRVDETVSKIKIIFEDFPYRMAKRAAIITDGAGSGGRVTAVSCSYLYPNAEIDFNADIDRYFCVTNASGTTLMLNVPYISVTNGVFTLPVSGHGYEAGETINIGDYLLIGKEVTTHSNVSSDLERFYIYYVTLHLRGTKGSSEEALKFLTDRTDVALSGIVDSYAIGDKDYTEINIDDCDPMFDLLGEC